MQRPLYMQQIRIYLHGEGLDNMAYRTIKFNITVKKVLLNIFLLFVQYFLESFINLIQSEMSATSSSELLSKKSFKEKKLTDIYRQYDRYTGKLKEEGRFQNGVETGVWRTIDADGDEAYFQYRQVKVGAICKNGTKSQATGRGACSKQGGVKQWIYEMVKVPTRGTGKYKETNENSEIKKEKPEKKEEFENSDSEKEEQLTEEEGLSSKKTNLLQSSSKKIFLEEGKGQKKKEKEVEKNDESHINEQTIAESTRELFQYLLEKINLKAS